MDALLWELLAQGNPDDKVELLLKLQRETVLPTIPIEIIAQIGTILSCRVQRSDIICLRQDKAVASLKAPRTINEEPLADATPITTVYSEEDFSANETIEANETINNTVYPFTGKGVLIGIADWGIDFTHPNFLNADGTSRFFAIWNQGGDYDGVNPYGYGYIHSQSEINEALRTETPFECLNYYPAQGDIFHEGMHGTHVLDIAAGNGTVGNKGIAPEATLIAVHLATQKNSDLDGLGNSVRLFDALHYMDNAADEKSLVINLSVGSHGDAHRGVSLIEQAIDILVTQRKGRAIVQSCGNYQTARAHSTGTLATGLNHTLKWIIPKNDRTLNELEIWYPKSDIINISLIAPDGKVWLKEADATHFAIKSPNTSDSKSYGNYYHRLNEPNTHLNHICIYLSPKAGIGVWQVVLHGQKINDGRFDAWIERDAGSANQSRFDESQVAMTTNTGAICNGFFNIAVAAYDAHNTSRLIGNFSSAGPTADNRQKPDLAAPGVNIKAAKSASPRANRSEGELCTKSGTSMASPFVTGSVAVLMEAANKPLSILAIRKILSASCMPLTNANPNRYGTGILEPALFIKQLTLISNNHPSTIMNYYDDYADSYDENYEEGRRSRRRLFNRPARQQAPVRREQPVNTSPTVRREQPRVVAPTQPQEPAYEEPMVSNEEPFEEPVTVSDWAENYMHGESTFGHLMEFMGEDISERYLNEDELAAKLFDALHPQRTDADRAYFERYFNPSVLPGGSLENRRINKGDLIIRRQYGHNTPAVWGVVVGFDGHFALVRTPQGTNSMRLRNPQGRMHWETMAVRGKMNYAGYTEGYDNYAEDTNDDKNPIIINSGLYNGATWRKQILYNPKINVPKFIALCVNDDTFIGGLKPLIMTSGQNQNQSVIYEIKGEDNNIVAFTEVTNEIYCYNIDNNKLLEIQGFFDGCKRNKVAARVIYYGIINALEKLSINNTKLTITNFTDEAIGISGVTPLTTRIKTKLETRPFYNNQPYFNDEKRKVFNSITLYSNIKGHFTGDIDPLMRGDEVDESCTCEINLRINFDSAKYKIDEAKNLFLKNEVATLREMLDKNPKARVSIIGHTDLESKMGTMLLSSKLFYLSKPVSELIRRRIIDESIKDNNTKLGLVRAMSTKEHFIANGIPAEKIISVSSRGEEDTIEKIIATFDLAIQSNISIPFSKWVLEEVSPYKNGKYKNNYALQHLFGERFENDGGKQCDSILQTPKNAFMFDSLFQEYRKYKGGGYSTDTIGKFQSELEKITYPDRYLRRIEIHISYVD